MTDYSSTPCMECGEQDNGNYFYAFPDGKTKKVLCSECAVNAGFCISCGGFFGGTEEFLRSGFKGCCVDCKSEIDGDSGLCDDPLHAEYWGEEVDWEDYDAPY